MNVYFVKQSQNLLENFCFYPTPLTRKLSHSHHSAQHSSEPLEWQFSKYITITVNFIIKMHYISCFLNLFGGGRGNWNSYYDLCKNKNKAVKQSYKTKNAESCCGRNQRQTRWSAFNPSDPPIPTPKKMSNKKNNIMR